MLKKAFKPCAILTLLFMLFSLPSPLSVLAIGVGVTPKELNFDVRSGGSATEILYVVNTGENEAKYKVYVDKEYEAWFDINPEGFSLPPQAHKEVQITVSPSLFSFGDTSTYVYVLAVNPSPQLGAGTGIQVPAHIHMSNLLLWIAIGVAAALLAALITYLIRRRKAIGNEVE
jgi:hypothetical protein